MRLLDQGYEGIVTIDGNDKDDPVAIPQFIEALRQGFDFVQASRFISGVVGAMNGRGDEGLDAPDAGEVEIFGSVQRQRGDVWGDGDGGYERVDELVGDAAERARVLEDEGLEHVVLPAATW